MFSDVRASLKHAGTPVEKPINPAAYGGVPVRKGQPTINLGADKMAAFLSELKTHRLRKVGQDHLPVATSSRSQPAARVREIGDVGNRSEVLPQSRLYQDVGNRSEIILPTVDRGKFMKRKFNEVEQEICKLPVL